MQLLEARFVLFRDSPFVRPTLHLGYGWVERASTLKACLCQISLLCSGQDALNWAPAAETTSQAAVPMDSEAAQTLLGLLGAKG